MYENVDVMIIDVGYKKLQYCIDHFSDKVNKAIFIHDVIKELAFPLGWEVEYRIDENYCVAVRK
jgi:hypothetical protein